jgi:hypothetical protein
VSGVPTVWHPGDCLGHTPQSCGHLTPLRRVQGGQLIEQHRGGLLVSAMAPPPASMTHARRSAAQRAELVAALADIERKKAAR